MYNRANREIKQFTVEIARIERLLRDEKSCITLKNFVKASRHDQDTIRQAARDEGVDIVLSILDAPGSKLTRAEVSDLRRCHEDFMKGIRKGDPALLSDRDQRSNTGPHADRFKLLKRLLRLYALKRGRKLSVELWSPSLENFFKSTVELFLPVLSAISKVSNLSDRLGDLKRFLDDLCEVVLTSKRGTGDFLAVCERHEQVG